MPVEFPGQYPFPPQFGDIPDAWQQYREEWEDYKTSSGDAWTLEEQDYLDSWKQHWKAVGQAWRTEPEIWPERQEQLTGIRGGDDDIPYDDFITGPFARIEPPLTRADIEWLLMGEPRLWRIVPPSEAAHYTSEADTQPPGPLYFGATDLRHTDLSGLPLSGVGFARAHLEGVSLAGAHLEYADFSDACMDDANLEDASLDGAQLPRTTLKRANFHGAHMHKVKLSGTKLESVDFDGADLSEAVLEEVELQGISLRSANLSRATFRHVDLTGAVLDKADLSGVLMGGGQQSSTPGSPFTREVNLRAANLVDANLSGAVLDGAVMEDVRAWRADFGHASLRGTNLYHSDLGRADLTGVHLDDANCATAVLSGTTMYGAHLDRVNLCGADLRDARFDFTTDLKQIKFDSYTMVADVLWNGAALTQINWEQVRKLGDDTLAAQGIGREKQRKAKLDRLHEYERAVRAYRQLATALRNQGINEYADYFAHRAHKIQRVVLWRRKKPFRLLWSWFLELLAGYGYEPWQTAIVYVFLVLSFAANFQRLAPSAHLRLSFLAACVLSVASFHGRGFLPTPNLPLDSPMVVWGGVEAVLGLVIEASFIATFTQRFFGK